MNRGGIELQSKKIFEELTDGVTKESKCNFSSDSPTEVLSFVLVLLTGNYNSICVLSSLLQHRNVNFEGYLKTVFCNGRVERTLT